MSKAAKVTRPVRAAVCGLGIVAALSCATPAKAAIANAFARSGQVRTAAGNTFSIGGTARMQQGLGSALGLANNMKSTGSFGMLPSTTMMQGPQATNMLQGFGSQQNQANFQLYNPSMGTTMQTGSPLVRDLMQNAGWNVQVPNMQQGAGMLGSKGAQSGMNQGGMPGAQNTSQPQQPGNNQGQTQPTAPTNPSTPTTPTTDDTNTGDTTTPEIPQVAPVTVDIDIPEDVTAAFSFSDSGVVAVEGSEGYKIDGSSLTINAAGHYYITGSCAEGNIKVKKGTTGVTLTLDNLTLTSTTTAPLAVNKGSEAMINVAGTVTLNDNEDIANDTEDNEDFEGAALKVKGGATATITGSGTLNVNGTCKNGIKGADGATVNVAGATVNVNAANNGIACDNVVNLTGGSVNIVATNEGIKAEIDEDDTESAGVVNLAGSVISVNAGDDGVQASTDVNVTAGSATIVAASDGIQGTNNVHVCDGVLDITTGGGYRSSVASDASAKGLKSDGLVSVEGGTILVNAADDGLHSDNSVTLAGGTITIQSGDDGVHADNVLTVSDGSVIVKNSVEGLEGTTVNIAGGDINITSSDDGVNAANKNRTYGSNFNLAISGGTMYVNAGGDGLDSNGSMSNTGGVVEVYGSSQGGNGATDIGDWGSSWNVNGGTIFAAGTDMAVTPTSGTYVMFGSGMGMGGRGGMSAGSGLISKGASISVVDASGNVVFSGTAGNNESYAIFASPSLVAGQTYSLTANGSTVATATAGSGSGAVMGGQQGQQPGQQGQQPGQQGQQPGQMNGNMGGFGMGPGMGR